jgi:branched-subunit amino acid transport protein
LTLWLVILFAGLLTFGTRLSFIVLLHRIHFPNWFLRSLRFVPFAVLSGIILPQLATRNDVLDFSFRNPQLIAGALAILVAWRTKNVLLTILVGMGALLLLQAVFANF